MRAFLAVVLTFLAIDAFACSCLQSEDPLERIGANDAVFRGTVLATRLVFVTADGAVFLPAGDGPVQGGMLQRVVVLEVVERFRGELGPIVTLATGGGGGDCGYVFEDGKTYLVHGQWSTSPEMTKLAGSPRALTTSICTVTSPESDAAELLPRLRARWKPTAPRFVPEP